MLKQTWQIQGDPEEFVQSIVTNHLLDLWVTTTGLTFSASCTLVEVTGTDPGVTRPFPLLLRFNFSCFLFRTRLPSTSSQFRLSVELFTKRNAVHPIGNYAHDEAKFTNLSGTPCQLCMKISLFPNVSFLLCRLEISMIRVCLAGPSMECTATSCANMGVCIQEWNSFRCDCDMTSFTGDTCAQGRSY